MLLEAYDIRKSFPGNPPVEILKGISLHIHAGELVAIVGSSGAGKSTLLHILGTLDKPDSGRILFRNEEVSFSNSRELDRFRNKNIGFVFQFHQLLPELTAAENIMVPCLIAGQKMKVARDRAMQMLELFHLTDRAKNRPSALSGGEQQRVALARALANDPPLILADEPSGNLDAANALEMHTLFVNLASSLNKAFVVVTHNPLLADMAHRVLTMKDGQLITRA